jgi:DNA gyrase/topoisomerase IV subunit B
MHEGGNSSQLCIHCIQLVSAQAKKGKQVLSFYTLPEYESWRENLGNSASTWEIKYYKGLGTSNAKEAKEYFAAMDHHKKHFVWDGKLSALSYDHKAGS